MLSSAAMETKQPSLLGVAIRDLARLRKVASTVARHGFGELLLKTPLGRRLLARGEVSIGDGGEPPLEGTAPVRFTSMLASLGPTFIKLGQILSMRQDLFARDWIAALETLQDAAPVVPFADIRRMVEHGLGLPLTEAFATFDEQPLATASIAQTHLATTHEGDQVVVKVQRQGIEDMMRGDLDLLYLGAQVLEASIDEMQLVGVTQVVTEFEKALLKELNFGEELSSLLRMRALLDPERTITVPRPYPELSSKTVLTMQFFKGKPVRTIEPRTERARKAVEEIVHSSCKQVFLDGFFHGDPHAGNILINDQDLLCLIDLGLVGSLTHEQREDLVTLIIATIANDSSTIARVLLKMGTPTQRVSLQELKSEIERIRAKYLVVTDIGKVDSAGFVQEFAQAAQKFRIKLAPEYSILAKSAATIEGIIRNLYPDVDLVGITRPYVTQVVADRLSPQALFKEVLGEASTLGSMVRRLPTQIDQLMHDFETGNLQLRAVTPELDALPALLHQGTSRIVLALFASAMTLCSSLVLPDHQPHWIQLSLSVASGLCGAGAWIILLGWHVLGRGKPVKLTPWVRMFKR